MNTSSMNQEWDFVAKEIAYSKKGGIKKGEMLFEFQILLSALCESRNLKEKRMLKSIYEIQKDKYKNL